MSDPFLKSWLFLKRQTTLGEHKGFEDAAFSPHGEIKYYHGTTKTPADAIMEQGLHPFLSLVGEGVFTSNDARLAGDYGKTRAKERNEPAAMFGVREGVTSHQLPVEEDPDRVDELVVNPKVSKVRTFDNAIPREFLVPLDVPEDSWLQQQQAMIQWALNEQGKPEQP
tara:strand:+ start:1146 stop:1649 length:504 start_codon:yes stop_codon:yes gene_type:complete